MSEMREESATNGKVGRRGEERCEIFESVVGLFVQLQREWQIIA